MNVTNIQKKQHREKSQPYGTLVFMGFKLTILHSSENIIEIS